MNRTILKTLLALLCAFSAGSAFAWPQCKAGGTAVIAEGSKDYVCPCGNNVFVTPTQSCPANPPAGQPITVSTNPTSTSGADADAAAKAAAESKAAAAALSAAVAAGGAGGNVDSKIANENWNKMSQTDQQAFMASLNQSQKQAFKASLDQSLTNNSPSSATAGGAQVATTNYSSSSIRYGVAIQLPAIQLTPGHAGGELSNTTTQCSMTQYKVEDVGDIEAHVIGIVFNNAFKNGKVQKLTRQNGDDKKPLLHTYSEWEDAGIDDRGNLVQRRYGYGEQFIIDSYLVGSSTASGINIGGSGQSSSGAGGLSRTGAITTYGNNIIVNGCTIPEQRIVYVPKAPKVSEAEIADALKLQAGMQWKFDVPVQRIEISSAPCKMKKYKDLETGAEVEQCPGAKGTVRRTRIVDDRTVVTGTLVQGASAAAAAKK